MKNPGAALVAALFANGAAAAPMMSAPKAATAQSNAALVSKLAAQRAARGLDSNHGLLVSKQHPGLQGTQVVRTAPRQVLVPRRPPATVPRQVLVLRSMVRLRVRHNPPTSPLRPAIPLAALLSVCSSNPRLSPVSSGARLPLRNP